MEQAKEEQVRREAVNYSAIKTSAPLDLVDMGDLLMLICRESGLSVLNPYQAWELGEACMQYAESKLSTAELDRLDDEKPNFIE